MVETQSRKTWIWRIVFGLSLGFNVLVVGAAVGLLLSGGGPNDRPPPMQSGWTGPLIGALPPEPRREILSDMRAAGRELGFDRRALANQRDEGLRLIEAEEFDMAAFLDLLNSSQDKFDTLTLRSNELLAERLAQMPTNERQAYAERLKRFESSRKFRDRHHDGKRRPDEGPRE